VAKQALIIIAQEGYQEQEYTDTRKALEDGGFTIVVASSDAGACAGKKGATETATLAMKDVNLKEFHCVAFIGGPGAAVYAKHPDALRIAHEAAERGMPMGAICIAPIILANAGVLRWKKATVWNEDGKQRDVMEDAGATFTGEDVTIDGMIVTANGPKAAAAFGKALVGL
jgi:protease I